MWWWVLLWVVLVVAGAVVLGMLLMSLWRRSVALFAELGTAAERMGRLGSQLEHLDRARASLQPAVFTDPAQLRRERERVRRERRREQRRRARL